MESHEKKPDVSQMNSQFFRVLAWNVSELRYTHRLTQTELAEKAGLTRDQISHIERGFGRTSFETLITLADFFGVKVAKLCEDVPRGRNMRWRMRKSVLEGEALKFSKEFSEAPKISLISLSSRKWHRIQVQKNFIYDFVGLSGRIMIDAPEVFESISAREILSLTGSGRMMFRSCSDVPRSEMLVIQSFVRDGN